MFLILIFSICSRKPKSNTCIIEKSKQIIILTNLYLPIRLRQSSPFSAEERKETERDRRFPSSTTATDRDVALSSNRATNWEISRLSPRRGKKQRERCRRFRWWRRATDREDVVGRRRRQPPTEAAVSSKRPTDRMRCRLSPQRGENEKKKHDGSQRHLFSSHLLCDAWQIRNDASRA